MTRPLLTHSATQMFKRCAMEYNFAHALKIRPTRTSNALHFGSVWHGALEADDLNGGGAEYIRTHYSQLPAWISSPEEEHKWQCEYYTAAVLFASHQQFWREQKLHVVATEQTLTARIINPLTMRPSRSFDNAGKVDRIVELPDGRMAIQEYKTTSEEIHEPGSIYWRRLTIDEQISRYMMLARANGYDVTTVLYDVTRKPSIRPGKNQTPAEWGEKLQADIIARPEFYFQRREIPRVSADIADFARDLWNVTESIYAATRDNKFPRNTGSCVRYNSVCPYFGMCTNGFDPSRDELPQGFERVKNVHPEL